MFENIQLPFAESGRHLCKVLVVSEIVICLALYFLGTQMNYETILYTTHNSESSLFAASNIWFVLGAARLVVGRLVGFVDAIA